jgi:hypothetical protein
MAGVAGGGVGLAVAGLGIWVAFVITAAPVLAWRSAGALTVRTASNIARGIK